MTRKLFKVKRKGYDTEEADRYISVLEERANLLQEELNFAKSAINAKDVELNDLRSKRELITGAIISATEKAGQIEQLASAKYKSEMEQLKAFHERWLSFYAALCAKFPLSGDLRELKLFNESMENILSGEDLLYAYSEAQAQFESESRRLAQQGNSGGKGKEPNGKTAKKDSKAFDPEEQIRKFLEKQSAKETLSKGLETVKPGEKKDREKAATSEVRQTFSFEEALNPVQPLEEILKELGIK